MNWQLEKILMEIVYPDKNLDCSFGTHYKTKKSGEIKKKRLITSGYYIVIHYAKKAVLHSILPSTLTRKKQWKKK